jgi:hypothetical protein
MDLHSTCAANQPPDGRGTAAVLTVSVFQNVVLCQCVHIQECLSNSGKNLFTAELIMLLARHTKGMKISAMLTEQNFRIRLFSEENAEDAERKTG